MDLAASVGSRRSSPIVHYDQNDDLSMELGSTKRGPGGKRIGPASTSRQLENPHSQVVSNAKPFLENLEKVQSSGKNNKSKKFINDNLVNVNVVTKDKAFRLKRGSQPASSRNMGNNTQVLLSKDVMGDSLPATKKRKQSTIK